MERLNKEIKQKINVGCDTHIEPHNKGITLISLIITVVLLIILAGVLIGASTDNDGLIDDAQEEVEKANNRIAKDEQITQNIMDEIKDELSANINEIILDSSNVSLKVGETKTLAVTIVPSNLSNKAITWNSSNPNVATINNGVITAINGGTATITATTQDGRETASCIVTVIDPNPYDKTKVPNVVIETSTIAGVSKERIAPIPTGYTASQIPGEDTISGGLVIYQGNTSVSGTANSTEHINAMESRNQYVWIPVDDINDMVMCKKNGSNGTCELDYNVTTPNEITCKTHGFNTTGYDTTAKVLAKTDIDTVGLAGRVQTVSKTNEETTADGKKIYTYTQTSNTNQTFSANSGYREPAIITGNSSGTGTSYDGAESNLTGIGDGTVATFKAQLNKDFIEMAKSVAKYGGFYISRYEPSYENSKVISKKNKAVLTTTTSTSGNKIAGNMWYGLYNKTLNNVEKDASVNSHMIWGCQYDQVIKFLGTEAQTGHNYQTTSQVVTGYAGDQDILNNIYDLEGNNYEWTAQAYSTDDRVIRGCFYGSASNSNFYPASFRSNRTPRNTGTYTTTRPTLYVIP